MPRAPVIAFQPAIAAARALSGVLSLTTDAMPTSIEAPAAPAASAATQSTTTLGAKATASSATRPSADPNAIATSGPLRSLTTPQARNETVVAAEVRMPMMPTSESDRSSRST